MDINKSLTTIASFILAVSAPGLIISARSTIRAIDRLRQSPDNPLARFDYFWLGTFMLLFGLGSVISAALLLALKVGTTILAIIGLIIANLSIQPIAILFCWMGVRKFASGVVGQVFCAGRRIPESELADLPSSERRGLVWLCVHQGVVAFAFGTAMIVGCAGLLIRALSN